MGNHSTTSVVICLKNRTFAVSQTSHTCKTRLPPRLWFAWKIVLLQYHKHPGHYEDHPHGSCDLLEKSYFCSITNIRSKGTSWELNVVICLKNRTFAVSQTSVGFGSGEKPCCDLLEKSYFCSITNIQHDVRAVRIPVVICLKNRTFAVSQTSTTAGSGLKVLLWFAWKIVLLQYHKHLIPKRP